MRQYIGTKMIQAEPAMRFSDGTKTMIVELHRERTAEEADFIGRAETCDMGYRVIYPDGYKSWSPRDVFEAAYLPLEVNPELKTAAPSISEKMVEDFISGTEVLTMGGKTTVVRAVLRNGFEIVESSSCVSAENYDEAMGAEICMEHIKSKIWMLLGFLLQTAVHGVKAPAGKEARDGV